MAKPSKLELARTAAHGGFSIIGGAIVAVFGSPAAVGWIGAGMAAIGGLAVVTGMLALYKRKAAE